MKVTFLIGNGFDRNLGLATSYSEFIDKYKNKNIGNETLKKFRAHINDNEKLWSEAEVALGKCTGDFEYGKAEEFSECHEDICEELALYLKNQENRIEYDVNKEKIKVAMKKINTIIDPFPTEEKRLLEQVYLRHKSEFMFFNFICFNYTSTLDRCVSLLESDGAVIGTHKNGNQIIPHKIGDVCHVHGTVDREMVFGVNDDSQILKNDIFDCVNGDIYKNLLIKRNANQSYQENTDGRAENIINESNIIYIYGMSIGTTDRLWWERICRWLELNEQHHLIIQIHEMPTRGAFPVRYQIAVREQKKRVLKYGDFDEPTLKRIADQVHITEDNIFEDVKGIAISEEEQDTKC